MHNMNCPSGTSWDREVLKKDKNIGFGWQLEAAKNGHVTAQFRSGRDYSLGRVIAVNHQKSVYWIRKAAENGHAVSQFYLYEALATGKGVAKNPKEAEIWANRAYVQRSKLTVSMRRQIQKTLRKDMDAPAGKPASLLKLALAGANKSNLDRMDIAELKVLARNGIPNAQYELADRYNWGIGGVKKGYFHWFSMDVKSSQERSHIGSIFFRDGILFGSQC